MKIQIIKSKKEDYKKFAEIYKTEFSKPPYNELWTKKKAIQKINILSKYCDIWKIIYNREIAGFVAINPSWFFPGKYAFGEVIAIKKEFQEKGIGKFDSYKDKKVMVEYTDPNPFKELNISWEL